MLFDDDSETISVDVSTPASEVVEPFTARRKPSLETMPDEILDSIFSLVTLDPTRDRYINPRVDLFSCLLVSKPVHDAALRVMYRQVTIPQSKAFYKFCSSLSQEPSLGRLVQALDFSHYSSIGFGRSRGTSAVTPFLTPLTLRACLNRTPNLKAFLVHEHIDDELDVHVLSKLFRLKRLEALDLCACSSRPFVDAFSTAVSRLDEGSDEEDGEPLHTLPIKRLSLHECTTLRPAVFEQLLPRLKHLTHLDVAHTMITDKALMSISSSARITHLNLERCTQVTGGGVVQFLTQHPAARDMIYLNLMADASRYRLFGADDLHALLPQLPRTLRSLNIGGALVVSDHTPSLRTLATHVEELGLKGASLSLSTDISVILGASRPRPSSSSLSLSKMISHFSRSNDTRSGDNGVSTSAVRYIDLTDVSSVTQMSLNYSPAAITTPATLPLEVIEVGGAVLAELQKRTKNLRDPDWVVRELGRRGWYVRQHHTRPSPQQQADGISPVVDDGSRGWKMGGRWWGMRKIPVWEQEVGGMYGYFMFKRN